ncbi:ribosomal protein S5 domain 2-type protein [Globomyces pollinis-pini]|nr:ribosomal protein S5 domain 2-type protein [Globomyces pollinis-pini]
MSRIELISPEGLRVDGRRAGELRRFYSKIGSIQQADGSAYVEMGNTKVIVGVYGPKEQSKGADRSMINVEFNIASFASSSSKNSKTDRRQLEMASFVKRTFEPVIQSNTFSRSEIDIFIQIIQTDGGILHAAINATCLAIIDAGIPMSDYVVACSAGYANDQPMMDLNYIEESAESPLLTLALCPKSEKITLLNMECRLHLDNFEDVMTLAKEGCMILSESLDETIRQSANR